MPMLSRALLRQVTLDMILSCSILIAFVIFFFLAPYHM